jgi:hypothetical protein
MLRSNPLGGRPMKALGAVDWDETRRGFQHKLGYCTCGKKVLATTEELEEITTHFGYLVRKERGLPRRIAIGLLNRLV